MNKLHQKFANIVYKQFNDLIDKKWDQDIPPNIFSVNFINNRSFRAGLKSTDKVDTYIVVGEFEKKIYDEDISHSYEIDYYICMYLYNKETSKNTIHLFLDSYTYNSILLNDGLEVIGFTIPDLLDNITQKVLLDDIDFDDLFE